LVEQRSKFLGEVWIRCKRLILKLSPVLSVEEVKGPYMHPNQMLIPTYVYKNGIIYMIFN
jgi:hypothetical protein